MPSEGSAGWSTGFVDHAGRIENGDVGRASQRGCGLFASLWGCVFPAGARASRSSSQSSINGSAFSSRTYMAEDARECPGAARMPFAVAEAAIAADHRGGTADRGANGGLRDGVRDDHSAGFAVLCKGFRGQALPGGSPLQVSVIDAEPRLPALLKYGRTDAGAERGIRIAAGRQDPIPRACAASIICRTSGVVRSAMLGT